MKSTLLRYESSWKLLWALMAARGFAPETLCVDNVAAAVAELFNYSPNHARNAYSAILLFPGFSSLRFHTLIQPLKKKWNKNLQKYAMFWDATELLLKLAQMPVEDSMRA